MRTGEVQLKLADPLRNCGLILFYALPVITRNIAFIVFNKIIFPLPSLPLQSLLLHRMSSRHLAVYSSTYTLAAAQCKHGNTGTDLDSVFNP